MSKDKIKDKIDDGGGLTPMHNLTIRDYFAAKAMAAIITTFNDDTTAMPEQVARLCYKIADAMLVARKGDK